MDTYITGKKITNTAKDAQNTAEYVVARLVDLGIHHAFTIPGDFSFALDRALNAHPQLQNIINANELNASYAADGYARVKGAAILCTTYAVGELSALNGVMGAKAENNIIFHLVGTPSTAAAAQHKQLHHTLGDGIFGQFFNLSASATCVAAVITPENAVREMNRIIREAFRMRQPAYISIALDQGKLPITDTSPEDDNHSSRFSCAKQLQQALDLITHKITAANSIIILPALKLDRYGLSAKALRLIEKLNVPFAIMPHDKAVIDQNHPNYLGYYAGELSDSGVAAAIENADLILDLGEVYWSDFNTAGFSNNLNIDKVLTLAPLFVKDSHNFFGEVFLDELLTELINTITPKNYKIILPQPASPPAINLNQTLTVENFYIQLLQFLKSNDILVVETGSSSLNLPKFPLPQGVKYHNQTLWGSIGWATPAALGIALAAPDQRTILVTGEGSHQLTLNELGAMGRYKIKPIIFCINNNGYAVERALELDPDPEYDDLAQLNYTQLPQAFGCEQWLSLKASTNQELQQALNQARDYHHAVYIELITGKYDYGATVQFFNQHLTQMYK
jgi:indolepyruvate decarboxylase